MTDFCPAHSHYIYLFIYSFVKRLTQDPPPRIAYIYNDNTSTFETVWLCFVYGMTDSCPADPHYSHLFIHSRRDHPKTVRLTVHVCNDNTNTFEIFWLRFVYWMTDSRPADPHHDYLFIHSWRNHPPRSTYIFIHNTSNLNILVYSLR